MRILLCLLWFGCASEMVEPDPNIELSEVGLALRRPNQPPLAASEYVQNQADRCMLQVPDGRVGVMKILAVLKSPVDPPADVKYHVRFYGPSGTRWLFGGPSDWLINAGEWHEGRASREIAPDVAPQAGAGTEIWTLEVQQDGETRKRQKTLTVSLPPQG